MLTDILTPVTLELILAGIFILFIIGSLIVCIFFLRRLKTMQRTMLQLHTSQSSTQDTVHQLQIVTQEHIQRLQIAQASTQTTVTATQQEMQRFVQDLRSLHTSSQTLMTEIKTLHSSSQALMTDWQKETTQLSRALRTSYQQGIWGESGLRQIVELAGMTQHCDFEIKQRLPNGQEPDLLIHMHNKRSIAVDAKTPSQVYLDAMKYEDEQTRTAKLKAYAHSVRETMYALAKKEYWKQLQPTLALVILFIPNEAMFRAALEYDLGLLDIATEKNVLLASPVTLIALLKAIEYGWGQEDRAQNVQKIVDQSKELHKELEMWLPQWQRLRKAIQTTSHEFNRAVAQYNTNVLPLIKALGMYDSTQLMKGKVFQLEPLQQPLDAPEERDMARDTAEEVQDTFWQSGITRSLKLLRSIFPGDEPNKEKEENV